MTIDMNNPAWRATATLGIGALAICGGVMNATFGWSQGHTDVERWVLTAASVVADFLKIILLPLAALAWSKGHRAKGAVCGLLWALCVSYGLLSASGFILKTRAHTQDIHAAQVREFQAHEKRVAALEASVQEAKAGINDKGRKIWESSGACLNPTTTDSKVFCYNYFVKLGELNKAKEEAPVAPRETADPQVAQLAAWAGAKPLDVATYLALGIAAFFETVSSLAGYATSKTVAKPGYGDPAARERRQKRRRQKRRSSISADNVVAFRP